ncbi:maleylpyruvate isomerase family mycothiol-dependent enzyme [Nocardioides sp.]|uniref:maleylpyruvate isomerase family mycothiol-dependent enzyme n=1 Tax=Nocardioides sp. TaxID=35761 RepID=UPI002613F115|nr:maleylpyruvate isomerase family mycothiol-dependent enzyme [Nocardioides sp.]
MRQQDRRGLIVARTFNQAREWAAQGDALLLSLTDGLTDAELRAPSSLPGWSVGNLVAHIAANGDALVNLLTWARTGVETPMYASPDERAAGIARGDSLSAAEARTWLEGSIARLHAAMDALTPEQWGHQVVTAQGRTVAATEVPWMRSREALVHAVDLDRGTTFADLPEAFNAALIEDILAKRGSIDLPEGPTADLAAWLAGRPHSLAEAPDLGPWL